jgi:hypothetical protein
MNNSEIESFGSMWNTVASLYGREQPESSIRVLFSVLRQFSLTDISNALNLHLLDSESGRFAPKPADIVAQMAKGKEGYWKEFINLIETRGPYQKVEFSDSRITAGVRAIGGWGTVNSMTYSELEDCRGAFFTAFEDAPESDDKSLDSICHDPDKSMAKLSSLVARIAKDKKGGKQ